MMWLNALHETLGSGRACVLVTICEVKGSAPRRVGARMLVSAENVVDTIGGGVLEQQAIEQCRSMLSAAGDEQIIESLDYQLGPDFSQCCGGAVTLNYEYHPACTFNVVVFGAGHVGQCVAKLLAELPCRVQFYDQRSEWLGKLPSGDDRSGAITAKLLGENTFTEIELCPDNAFFLVMTHSHELDFDIVEGVLSRGDSAYCGLIASKSKAAKFRSRLSKKGFTECELAKLTAPIGAAKYRDNVPMEVAIAAVSEMLSVRDERRVVVTSKRVMRADISQG